ncbi:serine hydrolase domain-containing protein [Marinicella sp. W31]|uniref:serine hydrolase domain-containing protein n=1 Tax=Marinicella sp. W31 TaxID=3023713 RepID=UPI003756CA2F
MKILFVFLLFSMFNGILKADIASITKARESELSKDFQVLLEKHKINTIGVSVIKAGKIAWMDHYGEQSPDVPASKKTLFDVGSITKTVATQTILQLVQEGLISLDEPMSKYWVDPDLIEDKRHNLLTPRMVLTHSTGLPNWRFFSQDGKLKFINAPGTTYGYSGEGFQYLAKFIEKKLNMPFEELAEKHVFKPVGMNNVSMSVRKANFPHIARALDEDGQFYGHYCRPEGWCSKEGQVSLAGGMVITVEDYSKFLIWSMQGSGLSDQLNKEINAIKVEQEIIKGFDCKKIPEAVCPTRQGYGLGWNVTQFEGGSLIGHGGSDWSLISLAYYYPDSQDGLVILLNGPSSLALKAMVDAIKLLDPESPKLHEYKFRADRNSN